MNVDTETAPEIELSPEARARRPELVGTPIEIDGQTWLFTTGHPESRAVWDRLYDHNVIRGRYDKEDVQLAAFYLLVKNYALAFDEAVALIRDVDPASLVTAVEAALFGPKVQHNTYTAWVESSLYANGLDPSAIPANRLHGVLETLVKTGRAVPPGEWISAQTAMGARAKLMNFGRD